MQALARLLERHGEFLKPDGGVDEISQDRLPHCGIAREIGIECFGEERLVEIAGRVVRVPPPYA